MRPDYSQIEYRPAVAVTPTGPARGDRRLTPEHIPVKAVYTPGDLEGMEHLEYAAGLPPFLRGPYATMYALQPWTIRQYAGFSTAEESNAFYRRNLAAGQKGLSVAFDLATHRGYDSDNERVAGDVGKAGVAIDSVEDMKILFDQIPLDQMSVSMTMNGAVLPVMAFYIVAAEEQGVTPAQLSGTIQNDILKEFMVRNTYIYPPAPSMRIIGDIFRYCAERMPQLQLHLDQRVPHAGSGGDGRHRTRVHARRRPRVHPDRASRRGSTSTSFAPRLSFFWAIGMNHFMEIAKLRAARVLWARLVKGFNPKNPKSMALRTHSQTSGWSLTAQDVFNNVTRTCVEALAAVLGHTQSLHTNALDEAIALPTRFLRAHRAQHADLPAGGDGHHEGGRPVGRQLLRRDADARADAQGVAAHPGGRGAWRHDEGHRDGPAEDAHRGSRGAAPGAHRLGPRGHRRRQQVPPRTRGTARGARGGQRGRAREPGAPPRAGARHPRCRARCRQALRVTDARRRRRRRQPARAGRRRGAGARDARRDLRRARGRVRAVPGRQPYDLRRVLVRERAGSRVPEGAADGRVALPRTKAGVRGSSWPRWGRTATIAARRSSPRPLPTWASTSTSVPLFQTPREAARMAVENDVHVLGVSSLAGGHKTLVPEVIAELKRLGRDDILVVVGGVIPPQDYDVPARRRAWRRCSGPAASSRSARSRSSTALGGATRAAAMEASMPRLTAQCR